MFIFKRYNTNIFCINIFFLLFFSWALNFTFSSSSIADDDLRINLFEFSLIPADQSNKDWKSRIEHNILEKLRRLPNIHNVDYISNSLAEMLGERARYYSAMKIRYIIEGKIETLPSAKRKEIQIDLYDTHIAGRNKLKYHWKRQLRDDLDTLLAWSDKISGEIAALIQGEPLKEVVFTYCFRIIGNSSNDVSKLESSFPKTLKTVLDTKGMSREYILKTFEKTGDVIEECENNVKLVPDIHVNEYVITGELVICQEPDEYVITVKIDMSDVEGHDVLIDSFREKYSTNFFDILADRIMTEWPTQ